MGSEEETWIDIKGVGEILSEQEALDALRRTRRDMERTGAKESSHRDADAILCSFLLGLGYDKVVEEFAKIEKWYA